MLLSVFTVKETICPRICSKSLPKSSKSQFPVDMRRSKTSLFKLPIKADAGGAKEDQIHTCVCGVSSVFFWLTVIKALIATCACSLSCKSNDVARLSTNFERIWKTSLENKELFGRCNKEVNKSCSSPVTLVVLHRSTRGRHAYTLFLKNKKNVVFRPRLNILIFLPILGWKYSCIIVKLQLLTFPF